MSSLNDLVLLVDGIAKLEDELAQAIETEDRTEIEALLDLARETYKVIKARVEKRYPHRSSPPRTIAAAVTPTTPTVLHDSQATPNGRLTGDRRVAVLSASFRMLSVKARGGAGLLSACCRRRLSMTRSAAKAFSRISLSAAAAASPASRPATNSSTILIWSGDKGSHCRRRLNRAAIKLPSSSPSGPVFIA
jgi:hypothetical protein